MFVGRDVNKVYDGDVILTYAFSQVGGGEGVCRSIRGAFRGAQGR